MSPPHVITGLAFCLSFVACTPSPATDPARAPAAPPPAPSASAAVVSKDAALALHRAAIVIDTHNDVTQRLMIQDANLAQRLPDGQTDLPRMREGGLDAEFLSVFVVPQLYPKEQAYPQALAQLDAIDKLVAANADSTVLARTAADVRSAAAAGKTAFLIGVEGGHALGDAPDAELLKRLEQFSARGARYMTLTWSNSNRLGGSSGDDGKTRGLTPFGKQVVLKMNDLGMVVDISHVSDATFFDAVHASKLPVLASHSSARALSDHPRNMTDDMLRAVRDNGGAVCVNFGPQFLDASWAKAEEQLEARAAPDFKAIFDKVGSDPKAAQAGMWKLFSGLATRLPRVPASLVIDHIEHVARVAGIDHVCLGSDYDGIAAAPAGLDDVSKLPFVTEQLLRRGFSESDVRKVLGENVLRVLAASEHGVAVGTQGAVASAEANASDIGVKILERGGNGVDAAIAVAFALGVTHPTAGNIGGGGFMVVRLPSGVATTIDYREVAPGKARPNMYIDKQGKLTTESRNGPLAAGIPGVVRGLAFAHKKFGSLPWAELLAPAIELARDGFRLDSFHADDLARGSARIEKYLAELDPSRKALRAAVEATLHTFQKPDGTAYIAGDTWRQPELGVTLQAIADHGPNAFYAGALAERMAKGVRDMGGIWTAHDLDAYSVVEREPIRFNYHGNEIISMPPPSAGGITIRQVLAAADTLKLEKLDWDSVQRIHLYVEALRRCFADRNALIGDPAFVKIPLEHLLDTSYVAERMADIDPKHATPSTEVGAGIPVAEKPHTTHFSVVDKNHLAVANTFTLNGEFGAGVQIPGTGVTLNNEMDDFTAQVGAANMFGLVQGPQNAIAPGKRMLSSMSPTIVVKDGELRAVVGSPGGPTIITTVAQILMQLIDHDRSLEQAVGAVRIHHQWLPDQILHEADLPPATATALEGLGHKLKTWDRIGDANCIELDPKTKNLTAVADVKRDGGKAAAY